MKNFFCRVGVGAALFINETSACTCILPWWIEIPKHWSELPEVIPRNGGSCGIATPTITIVQIKPLPPVVGSIQDTGIGIFQAISLAGGGGGVVPNSSMKKVCVHISSLDGLKFQINYQNLLQVNPVLMAAVGLQLIPSKCFKVISTTTSGSIDMRHWHT